MLWHMLAVKKSLSPFFQSNIKLQTAPQPGENYTITQRPVWMNIKNCSFTLLGL